jgi:hypothetical protein
VKKIFKSANTQLVLQGILGTLAVIHPGYSEAIALAMGLVGVVLPGYVKPAEKVVK